MIEARSTQNLKAKKGHRLAADEDGKCEITEEVLSLAILEGKSNLKNRICHSTNFVKTQNSPLMIEFSFVPTLQQTGTTVQKYKLQVHFSLLTPQLRWSMDLLLTYT